MAERPQAESLVERRLSRRFQVSLVVEGLAVGLVAGGVVTLFRLALSHAEGLLRLLTGWAVGNASLMLAWACVLVALLALVSWLMRWEPATVGSGIPQVEAEVAGHVDQPWHRVLLAKFVEGTAVTFAGLSMGREGPSVQLGAMAGKAVSRALRRGRGEERLLVTCGAAAGMSAAFHAPLTGILFAVEEIHRAFTAPLIISVMCSSVAADFLVSQALGVEPVLSLAFAADIPHPSYALVVGLGVVAGVLGALHNRGMFLAQRLLGRLPAGMARLAVPFALAGVAAFAWPVLMCGGDAVMEEVLAAQPPALGVLLALLAGKYVFTALCFGSGAPGGTLFPLVALGSLVGAAYVTVCGQVFGVSADLYPNFVALGIAGLFSAAIQAPVTAVVLVFELTSSLDALLSAAIVSIVAYVTAGLLRTDAFYEHLLEAVLGTPGTARSASAGEGKTLLTFVVGSQSRADGARVMELAWPERARVVTVRRGTTELIPTGATRLRAHDELVVIADESCLEDVSRGVGVLCHAGIGLSDGPGSRPGR